MELVQADLGISYRARINDGPLGKCPCASTKWLERGEGEY